MVAYLEEQGRFNLCLSFPEGVAVVIAAGFSVHFARGFDGYKPVDGFRSHTSQHPLAMGHQLPRRSVCTTTSSLFVVATEHQRGARPSVTAATVSCTDWPTEHRQAVGRQINYNSYKQDPLCRRIFRLVWSRYGLVAALWTLATALTVNMLYFIGKTLVESDDGKVAVVAVMQLAMSCSVAVSVLIIAYFDIAFERGAYYFYQ